jgi:hypothetical protein
MSAYQGMSQSQSQSQMSASAEPSAGVPSNTTAFTRKNQKLSPGLVVVKADYDNQPQVVHEVGTNGSTGVTVSPAELDEVGRPKRASGNDKSTLDASELELFRSEQDISHLRVRGVAGNLIDKHGQIIGIDSDSAVIMFGDQYEIMEPDQFGLLVPLE